MRRDHYSARIFAWIIFAVFVVQSAASACFVHLLTAAFAKAAHADAGATTDSAAIVDQIMKRIADMAGTLDKLPSHGLRSLLGNLIARLEVDMTTLHVELELAIPNAAAFKQKQIEDCMGLGERSSSRSSLKAQAITAMMMAVFDCNRPTKDCYDCRRRAACGAEPQKKNPPTQSVGGSL